MTVVQVSFIPPSLASPSSHYFQGSSNPCVISTLIEEDYFKRILSIQRLPDLSEADVEAFCDLERSHLKESLVSSEEDHGIHFFRSPFPP
jgi:hypothetical protein